MSDNSSKQGNRRRRRPRSNGGKTFRSSTPRGGEVQQTGFQKFLSIISFGLLGKPSELPQVAARTSSFPSSSAKPSQSRPPRERDSKPRREMAPSSPSEVATERLYVGNLSYDASESDLFELFNGVGSVRNAEVVVNNRTQRSKGFAFVTMGSVDEARRAVAELHGKDFMGRPLQLSGAKPIGSSQGSDSSSDEDSQEQSVAA